MLFRVSLLASVLATSLVTCYAQFSSTTQMTGSFNNSVLNTPRVTSQVNGTVESANGLPVSGARIELRNTENGSIVASAYSDRVGQFTIQSVELGHYEIVAYSGVLEARDSLLVQHSDVPVALRMPTPVSQVNTQRSGPTVSVSQYLVSDKARKEFERAQKAYSEGKTQEARMHCEKALETQPKYAEALTLVGLVDLSENHLDAAVEKLQSAIDADPQYPMAYIVMGATLNTRRQYQQALVTLERGVAINPTAWQAHFEMAKADLGLADYKAAFESARRAAAINEKYPPIQLAQAHALLGLKRYSEAVTLYERYLSSEPTGPDLESAQKALNRARSFAGTTAGK